MRITTGRHKIRDFREFREFREWAAGSKSAFSEI
jgi:hypothetical protein